MSPASATSAPARRELSVRATAVRLQTTERQVLRLLAAGLLRPVAEVGRALKVEASSVEQYESSARSN